MSEQGMTAKLMQPFPREAIKTRPGGGNSRLSYVEGHTVIHRLIDATGNQFDLRVLNVEQKGDLLTALVELTIPGLGSRQHMGVQKVSERGGEDLVKGAITDAMKKAATLFGVGLELYGPDYGAEDTAPAPRQSAPQPRPTPVVRPQDPRDVAARPFRPQLIAEPPSVLTNEQHKKIADARDLPDAGVGWAAVREHLRPVFETATKAQKIEIKREMDAIQAKYYPGSLIDQEGTHA